MKACLVHIPKAELRVTLFELAFLTQYGTYQPDTYHISTLQSRGSSRVPSWKYVPKDHTPFFMRCKPILAL